MSQPQYYLPAEWEPQSCIQLTLPHPDTDWRPYLMEITNTYRELIKAISLREDILLSVWDCDESFPPYNPLGATSDVPASDGCRLHLYRCQSNDTWTRDYGAITLVRRTDTKSSPYKLLDFRFNGWGEKFPAEKDNAITHNLYAQGAFNGELVDCEDFVLEGGSIESDGKGTIMTTSFCLLAPNRNQPMTKPDIERELLERLCAKRIIWLEYGRLIGDDTDGHIDTIVRFAPDDTLLYMGCNDEKDPQFEEFQLLEQELRELRTLQGNPYNLIKLPMPRPIYYNGDRLPATYTNFLVINGAVIVPTYQQEILDEEAKELIGSAFPDREVIGIDALTIIRQHGSIHCLTMQYPEGCLHNPFQKAKI